MALTIYLHYFYFYSFYVFDKGMQIVFGFNCVIESLPL